jgi:hypothetical protein
VILSARARWSAFGLVVALVTVLTAIVVVRAVGEQHQRRVPTAATRKDRALDLGAVLDVPHIVFRSTATGPTYGLMAAVPLATPAGDRSVSQISCDRVYASSEAGVCLAAERGAVTSYSARLLDGRLRPVRPIPIGGIPSRARISADGSWVAVTSFISGHGYGTIGFSTETTVTDRLTGQGRGNLETAFTTLVDGRKVTATDLNVWGVTFTPGPHPSTFYATVATGGRTWLVRGDLTARTLTAVRPDAECPSLSPDGRHLVYKKRAGSPTRWRYYVMDVRTGAEWPLAETRSIDDQAEWLDDGHVLYGLARPGSGETDVWVSGVRPDTAKPRIFMRDAWSPAVVRSPADDAQ